MRNKACPTVAVGLSLPAFFKSVLHVPARGAQRHPDVCAPATQQGDTFYKPWQKLRRTDDFWTDLVKQDSRNFISLRNSRRTSKQRVAGSSPAGIAKKIKKISHASDSYRNPSCTRGAHIRPNWRTQSQNEERKIRRMRLTWMSCGALLDALGRDDPAGQSAHSRMTVRPKRHDGTAIAQTNHPDSYSFRATGRTSP
jgi:hypothetical protein